MSSQAAMLKPVCGNVCSNAKAPPISLQGASPDAGLGHPQRPPAARALQPPPGRPPAHRAQRWCSLTSSWSARAIWCRASAAFRQRFGHAGHLQNPAQGHGAPATTTAADDAQRPARWDERLRFRPSLQRNIVKPRDWQKQPYPFVWPVRPRPVSHRRMARVLYQGAVGAGHPQLGAGPHHPRRPRADRADPHPGAAAPGRLGRVRDRHHRGCAARALPAGRPAGQRRHGGRHGRPGYPDARIFASHTHLLPLPVDEHGLITGTQLLGCDYLFVTPGHQCPTSVTLSRERRQPGPARPTA